MTEQPSYWNKTGKFYKAYDRFYKELVPSSGKASTPNGELLRVISKIYYRYYNDGDTYEYLLEDGYLSLTDIEDLNPRFLQSLHITLLGSYTYKKDLEMTVDKIMRFLILKKSTPEKIYNPETGRLLKITSAQGIKILQDLGCKIEYSFEY